MATLTVGDGFALDMGEATGFEGLADGEVTSSSSTLLTITGPGGAEFRVEGEGFSNFFGDYPSSGTVTGVVLKFGDATVVAVQGLSLPVQLLLGFLFEEDYQGLIEFILDGADTLTGADRADVLYGYFGDDTLNGMGGDDELHGGANRDTLDGGVGADIMVGGDGDDSYVVDQAGDEIIEISTGGHDTVRAAVSYSLAGQHVEHLTLTGSANLNGTGNSLANVLRGNEGVNRLTGGIGDDTYYVQTSGDTVVENSGEGLDEVFSSVGFSLYRQYIENLTLTGSANINGLGNSLANVITGNSGINRLSGGEGDDTYYVQTLGDTVTEFKNEGDDAVFSTVSFDLGGQHIESLTLMGFGNINGRGNTLNNTLTGNAGVNTLLGSVGDDTYYVQTTGDLVVEYKGEGDDLVFSTLSFSLAGQHIEALTLTGLGNINGGGNSLNNILTGNVGVNRLTGSLGDDTYHVQTAGDSVVESRGEGDDHVISSITFSLAGQHVERLTLTGAANLNATGNSLDNELTGNTGLNVLTGGSGDDTYVIQNAGDSVVERAGEGSDTVKSSVSFSLAGQYIEALHLTGSANINATGNSLDNTIVGNGGINRLTGGKGNDHYYVQNADDQVVEEKDGGDKDLVESSVSFDLGGSYIEDLVLTGAGALNGYGNSLNNIMRGNSGSNLLAGGKGDDTYIVQNVGDRVVEYKDQGDKDTVFSAVTFSLAGQYIESLILEGAADIDATGNSLDNILAGNSGQNELTGGRGDDVYIVQNAGDLVFESDGEGDDTVVASVSYSLAGRYVENILLEGAGHLSATGNSLDNLMAGNEGDNIISGGRGGDALTGEGGADTLRGEADDDILIGGLGKDSLSGGGGVDGFLFTALADSTVAASDEIVDLEDFDLIDLRQIDAIAGTAADDAFTLVDSFTGAQGQAVFRFNAGLGKTELLLDVNGDQVADMRILIAGNHEDFAGILL